MKSSNYNEAKKQVNELFSKRDYDHHRKIVFWYDEDKNFYEDITDDSFENIKLFVFEDNPLYLKYLLEIKDKESDYLLYFPVKKPENKDNLLLDILLYSDEYYADKTALTMRNLGLTNTDLRSIIEQHIKFFDNKERRKKLNQYGKVHDYMKEDDLRYYMLATLVKASHAKLEEVLKEVILDDSNTKYYEIEKFGLNKFFWNELSKIYNYTGVERIDNLAKTIVVTGLYRKTKLESRFPKAYNAYLIQEDNEDIEIFLERIKYDSRYNDFQENIAKKLDFIKNFKAASINEFKQCDFIKSIDEIIVDKLIDSLSNGSYDFDFFRMVISENRKLSNWWNEYENHYEMLLAALDFLQAVEDEIPWDLELEEYIENYVKDYYLIDRHYRQFMTYFSMLKDESDALATLEKNINKKYENGYLNSLSRGLNNSLSSLKGKWNFNNSIMSNRFFKSIAGKHNKMFVIISDAMRYEIGTELLEAINMSPVLKGSAKISHAISPIPSITKFGMASLLPNKKITYESNKVYVDGTASVGTESRNKILKSYDDTYAAIRYSDIFSMNQKEQRSYMKDKSMVYIYHDVIDSAGENEEHKVFSVVKPAIDEIVDLIKKLYNNLQIANFVVTADHGFMYRKKMIDESEKYGNITKLEALETSKRYLITEGDIDVDYTHKFSLDYLGDSKEVVTAYGYETFKTQGGGINFIHGGTSLQEIIIPIVEISELRSRSMVEKNLIGPVGVHLKSINRKITTRTFSLEFEQYEKVQAKKTPREVVVYFEDDKYNKVSGEYHFIADSNDDNLNSRITSVRFALENMEFNRNKQYDLVILDNNTNEEIERVPFAINIISIKPVF